jgi:hypothetical protein
MNKFDELMKKNMKAIIDTPTLINPEEKWQDFERRIAEKDAVLKKKKRFSQRIKWIAAAAALLLVTSYALLNPQVVIGFKDELFQWVKQADNNDYIFTERRNPGYEEGQFEGVTFEEAKSIVVFNLLYPEYLPEVLSTTTPAISITSVEYPISTVIISFQQSEQTSLTITQRNVLIEKNSNKFVPENVPFEELTLQNGLKVIFIDWQKNLEFRWIEKNVSYRVVTGNLDYREAIKVIESLK